MQNEQHPAVSEAEPVSHDTEVARFHDRITLGVRIANLLTVIVPFAGLLTAIVLLWGRGFDWLQLGILSSFYVLTVLGITVGFHRYFTHRAFETTRWMQITLAILGSMALEGPLIKWVALHRRHHQHSDTHDDPHSPHVHGGGVWGVLKGFWHAHIGWIFVADAPGLARYSTDLLKQRAWRVVSALFPLWVVIGLVLPAVVGGLFSMTWNGLLGFIWGGLVRIFLVHHVTWSVNSIGHLWGSQPFKSHDESRNNFLVGVLARRGWHNNHHAFPTSARHGLRWWQIDVSYYVIKVMAMCKLAWKVKLPSPQAIAAKQQA